MSVDVAAAGTEASPPRPRRWRWPRLALVGVLLAAGYLIAVWSTHLTLSGGPVIWSRPVPGTNLGTVSPAEQAFSGIQTSGYREVMFASRPGGEVSFGFDLHNGGPVPITVLSLRPHVLPGVIHDLGPVSAQLGPGRYGRMTAFHPVTLGPGETLTVGLTERVVCDPITSMDARMLARQRESDTSWEGDTVSPVVVHYRVLGLGTSQTVAVTPTVLVAMPYRACL